MLCHYLSGFVVGFLADYCRYSVRDTYYFIFWLGSVTIVLSVPLIVDVIPGIFLVAEYTVQRVFCEFVAIFGHIAAFIQMCYYGVISVAS